jgi:hypothetical protein
MKTISTIQQAYFNLLATVKVNAMDGRGIVSDLLKNQSLWQYVKPCWGNEQNNEFTIREVTEGSPLFDTICISATGKFLGKWKYFKHKWKADHMEVFERDGNTIVMYWFD